MFTNYYWAKYETPSGTYLNEVFIGSSLSSAKSYAKEHCVPGNILSEVKEYYDLFDALQDVALFESLVPSEKVGRKNNDPEVL